MTIKTKNLFSLTINEITTQIRLRHNSNTDNIIIMGSFNYHKKYRKNNKNKRNKYQKQYREDNRDPNIPICGSLEDRINKSCTQQGITHKEWCGFTYNKIRTHILPIFQCIKLNQRFPGSEGHHIMSGVVIFIPKNIHKSVWHNLKSSKNMKEINVLSMNYLENK